MNLSHTTFTSFLLLALDKVNDGVLSGKAASFTQIVKDRVSSLGVSEGINSLLDKGFQARMDMMSQMLTDGSLFEEVEDTVAELGESYLYEHEAYNSRLNKALRQSMEVYQLIVGGNSPDDESDMEAGEMLNEPETLYESVSQMPTIINAISSIPSISDFARMLDMFGVNTGYLIPMLKHSLSLEIALLVADMHEDHVIELDNSGMNDLSRSLLTAIEGFGLSSLKAGFWAIPEDEPNQIIRNIKIRKAMDDINEGITQRSSEEEMRHMLNNG
ncbi:hypothetical protein AB9P05_12850 [Roseivirga sp. BDSF3-8]|uniref:hypothetical protein n=1 Tax=Roseivirga sp. BDSF3-8 TaxID=3241598 RepID=UPI003531FE5B